MLPLQGPIPWEEFIFVVRLGSAGAARLALRRLLKMSASSIEQRRGALERWRPRLALPAAVTMTRAVEATSGPPSAPPRLSVAVAAGKRRVVEAEPTAPNAPPRLPMPAAAGKRQSVQATTGGGGGSGDAWQHDIVAA